MMSRIRSLGAALALWPALLSVAAHAQSTVNPNIPTAGANLQAAPIRANFQATYTDITKLLNCFAGTSAPASAISYQLWCDTTGAPTNIIVKQYDGTAWVQTGILNATAHTYLPALSVDANFSTVGGQLALASVNSGSILANCGASSAEPTSATFTACLDRVFGSAQGTTLVRGASAWAGVTPPQARASAALNIDQMSKVGDANYLILSTDRTVATNASLTAGRSWTLPAANAVNAGQAITVTDLAGGVTALNTLTIVRAGSDTITAGTVSATSVALAAPGAAYLFVSDGVSKWTALELGTAGSSKNVISAAKYGVKCDGSTNNDTALAAISAAVAAGGFDIEIPTTGQSCKYTTWDLHGLTNIRVRGGAGYTGNSSSVGAALECTRTDAAVCLNAKDTKGFVLSNLAMIKADAHTGIVLDDSSTSSTWNKNRLEHVEFKRASGSGNNGTALYVRNSVDLTIIATRFSHVNNGIVGGFNGETTTGTASLVCISCDFTVLNTAVLNPGAFWSFHGGNWEVTLAGAPVTLVSQSTDTVKSLGFYGVAFADATAAGTWITFNGGVWGFTMSGGSMSGNQTNTNGIAFNGGAAGTQGVSITGVNFATLATAISFSNVCSATFISGNVFTNVTSPIANGSGSCYTSNWWPANSPSAFSNAVSGSIYNGQNGADPLWTRNPVLGIIGAGGSIGFLGATSGTATIAPQAVAGTPTLTLPNTSGTFAVSAASPLALNATTGALTCSTCAATNAANTFTAAQAVTLSQGAQTSMSVNNSNTSTSASAAFVAVSNSGTFTASAGNNPNTTGQAGFTWTGAGGMLFAATHASGPLIFDSGGFNERVRILSGGAVNIGASATDLGGVGRLNVEDYAVTAPKTVGGLSTCNSAAKGARSFVTDANATFTAGIGAVVAAGGANNVPVTCDGTNWRIGAANDNLKNRMAA